MNQLKAKNIIIALTDNKNFRKSLLPSYKANRKKIRKPILLKFLKEYLKEEYNAYIRPNLEADDILGILATNPKVITDKKIIISQDKDLKTIPSWYWNPDVEGREGRPPILISEQQANNFFYAQILSGDVTDGYSGCPSIGKKRAQEIVSSHKKLIKTAIKSKSSKEVIRNKWILVPEENIWNVIVSYFAKQGLSEADALLQARMARILRHEDYNYKKKEPILWTPKLTEKQ